MIRHTVAIVLIVAVGASFGWLTADFFANRTSSPAITEAPVPDRELARTAPPATAPTQAGEAPPVPNRPPLPIRRVDSYGLDSGYKLSDWGLVTKPSGHVDTVLLNGVPAGSPAILGDGDVLTLSGWAGDPELGVRFPYVIASACGRVVAHAAVRDARPDVAKSVHPNLADAGWRMTVAGVHLPECEESELATWAVAPGGQQTLFALAGSRRYARTATKSDEAFRPAVPLQPNEVQVAPPVTLDVAGTVNIRRCAGTGCPILARLEKGRWVGLVLEESADWALVILPDRAGWIAKRYVNVTRRD